MEDDDFRALQKNFTSVLGLNDSEAETMRAILRHCMIKGGLPLGGFAGVAIAGAGAVVVPGLGAVPGWLAGFAAGFASGTLMCTMAHRGAVIEALKQTLSQNALPGRPSQGSEIMQLRAALAQVSASQTGRA